MKITHALLCVAAILAILFAISCTNEVAKGSEEFTENPTATELPMLPTNHTLNENGMVEVVVFKTDIKKGQKIAAKMITVKEYSPENLPENIISDKSAVYDKYALRDFYSGDYAVADYLVESREMIPYEHLLKREIAKSDADFVIVTDYIKADTGEDIYVPLQKLLDMNPGRTFFFPDGEYVISQSLLTTSVPEQSITFQFSSGALLRASDTWESGGSYRALICLGAYETVNSIKRPGSNFGVIGGRFDGNGVADGISIDAGRETLIKDVVITNVRYGIYVKKGTNNGSSDADIDDVTIVGNGEFNSVGIALAGDDNTITNARISNVGNGIMASNTTFISACTVENTNGARGTAGFFIGGNAYISDCTSINYDIGFDISGGTTGYTKQCSVLWTEDASDSYIAFRTGRLRFMIFGCRAEFIDPDAENLFLSAYEDGTGGVVGPIYDASMVADTDATKFYLTKGEIEVDEKKTK